jgi:endonuclease III
LSQRDEDVTTESLIKNLLEKIERLESHLVAYQEKVKEALMCD